LYDSFKQIQEASRARIKIVSLVLMSRTMKSAMWEPTDSYADHGTLYCNFEIEAQLSGHT